MKFWQWWNLPLNSSSSRFSGHHEICRPYKNVKNKRAELWVLYKQKNAIRIVQTDPYLTGKSAYLFILKFLNKI